MLGNTWSPEVRKIMALMAGIMGLGLLFYILLGFRWGLGPMVRVCRGFWALKKWRGLVFSTYLFREGSWSSQQFTRRSLGRAAMNYGLGFSLTHGVLFGGHLGLGFAVWSFRCLRNLCIKATQMTITAQRLQ